MATNIGAEVYAWENGDTGKMMFTVELAGYGKDLGFALSTDLTRKQAKVLRDRLDEVLKESK